MVQEQLGPESTHFGPALPTPIRVSPVRQWPYLGCVEPIQFCLLGWNLFPGVSNRSLATAALNSLPFAFVLPSQCIYFPPRFPPLPHPLNLMETPMIPGSALLRCRALR